MRRSTRHMVTPALFRRFPDPSSFADADPLEVEKLIYTTGFFRNKTKNIQGASIVLLRNFSGVVPDTMAELLTLPGVSRKTANVVLSHGFARAEGIAVDTHVFRVSRRLDLSRAPTPEGVEADLMELAPQSRWTEIADSFIWHGAECAKHGHQDVWNAKCSISAQPAGSSPAFSRIPRRISDLVRFSSGDSPAQSSIRLGGKSTGTVI